MANSNEQAFIEARQESYYTAMQNGVIGNILGLMSDDLDYSDITYNILNMNRTHFHGFVTQFLGGLTDLRITSKAVSGTKDFVAWEWQMDFASKEDNAAFGLSKGQPAKLNGVSLVWWRHEGGEGGHDGWKVVKAKDFSSPAAAAPA